MALYAIYLGTGQSIGILSIKSGTITQYVHKVAQIHYDLTGVDPRYIDPTPQSQNIPIHRTIKCVYDEIKCWEIYQILKNN